MCYELNTLYIKNESEIANSLAQETQIMSITIINICQWIKIFP
jgi:hypothetical protein